MRRKIIISNWKLNGSNKTIKEFISFLEDYILKITKIDLVISPPYVYIEKFRSSLISKNSTIKLGSQNVDKNILGPFTGEISISMLKDIGVDYVIIGHSERRLLHKESDDLIAEKLKLIKSFNLIPILCIGETENEYNCKKSFDKCKYQLDFILNKLGSDIFKNSIIAYEPIWAIGSGKPANHEYAQKISKFIRKYISNYNKKLSEEIIIIYGGSVNENNINLYLFQHDIDGVLVGSSSINKKSFSSIIKNVLTII